MTIKKSSAMHELTDSGTLIAFDPSSDIRLDITCDETFGFSVVFHFEANETGQFALKKDVDGQIITFRCLNFNTSTGTGTSKPVELATFNGRKLFLHFWVYCLGSEGLRKVEYNLYRE